MNAQAEASRRSVAIAVAPNGARRTRAEHPGVPLTPREIAYAAAQSLEAGAAMIHLHVRDPRGAHILDAGTYREAIAEIRRQVRDRLLVQITTDSTGQYRPHEQMKVVREVRPEAVSLAIREVCPDPASEADFADFVRFMKKEHVAPQFILYDAVDVARFADLAERGVIAYEAPPVIFVLGRYQATGTPKPADMLPLLEAARPAERYACFMLCAFSAAEAACAVAAALLGGDVRVGFENNILLPDGTMAPTNAALIRAVVDPLAALGIGVAGVDELRERYLV